MKASDFIPTERVTFGVLVIVGYILMVWYGASGHATGPNAEATVHDGMLALGPLVGVVIYSVFKTDRAMPSDGSAVVPNGSNGTNGSNPNPNPQ